jgi:hypothetical protein
MIGLFAFRRALSSIREADHMRRNELLLAFCETAWPTKSAQNN